MPDRTFRVCKVCGQDTIYDNQLCGPCFNQGLRGRDPSEPDCVLIEISVLVNYIGRQHGDEVASCWERLLRGVSPESDSA